MAVRPRSAGRPAARGTTRIRGVAAAHPLAAVTLGFAAVQAAITAGHVVTDLALGAPRQIVALNNEANLPTWWWSVIFLTTAAVAGGLYAVERMRGERAWFLALLALAFVALSLEEVAGLHERIGSSTGPAANESDWTLLYLPLVTVGAFVLLRTVRSLPRREGLFLLAGLAVFSTGYIAEATLIWNKDSLAETLIEENSEPLGAMLVAYALATQLIARLPPVMAAWGQRGT